MESHRSADRGFGPHGAGATGPRPVRPGPGAVRTQPGRPDERTYEQLYDEAKRRKITGRSKMSKTELERALGGR